MKTSSQPVAEKTVPLLMTVNEACAALNIGRSTVYGLLATKRLKSVKIGRSTRVTTDSIRAFVEESSGANEN